MRVHNQSKLKIYSPQLSIILAKNHSESLRPATGSIGCNKVKDLNAYGKTTPKILIKKAKYNSHIDVNIITLISLTLRHFNVVFKISTHSILAK